MGEGTLLDKPIKSVTHIHESFVNADRLQYYQQGILRDLKLAPEKMGGGIGDMFQWNR
jgi:hypothetical protein